MAFHRKSGNHPLIESYNKEFEVWFSWATEQERLINVARQLDKQPQPRYKLAKVIQNDPNPGGLKSHGIRIILSLVNKHERDEWIQRWGQIDGGPWDETRRSVHYYRTRQGILTSAGGGYCVIKNLPILITDEEWAVMLDGCLPASLQF